MYHVQCSRPLVRVKDLVTIHYYELEPQDSFAGEQHDFWELVYVDRGHIAARNGNERFSAHEGELLIHAPGVFHYARGDGEHLGYIFIISFTSDSPYLNRFRDLHIPLPTDLRALISSMLREGTTAFDMEVDGLMPLPGAPLGSDQLVRNYLEQFLILLGRREEKREPVKAADLPGEIILYLNRHVYGTVSIPELCETMYYGKTHLSALFRAATGQSILQYYNMLKINEAKRLLREQNISAAETAALLHYDNPQYFSRVFKKATGLAPGKFRNTVQP